MIVALLFTSLWMTRLHLQRSLSQNYVINISYYCPSMYQEVSNWCGYYSCNNYINYWPRFAPGRLLKILKGEGTFKLGKWGAEGFSHVLLQRQGLFELLLVRFLPMHPIPKDHNLFVLYCLSSLSERKTQSSNNKTGAAKSVWSFRSVN